MTTLNLYNTLTRQIEAFTPSDPKVVRMYVCGPTVYDEPHLGHARCYITWDVLYRFLKFLGAQQNFEVEYARNITDVDDKIIKKALAQNVSIEEITTQYTQAFNDAMNALNVESPTHQPYATKHIVDMNRIIEKLVQTDFAYVTKDGSVYYRTSKKSDYGKLCNQPLDNLESGARVEVDDDKENPLDFALWKAVPEDDPNGYDSPKVEGVSKKGRPGWHIECSAMIDSVFDSQPLDIHAGGYDLVFPHHENEIAQSEAYSGKEPFAKYWLHNGFVNVSGEKMSKSLGNFATIKSLLSVYKDPNIIRHFILNNKYRMPVDFSEQALEHSKNWVNKIYDRMDKIIFSLSPDSQSVEAFFKFKTFPRGAKQVSELNQAWLEAMNHDLNTAEALAQINALLKIARNADTDKNIRLEAFESFINLSEVIGFQFRSYESQRPNVSSDDVVEKLIEERAGAKANKDWARADEIRNQITEMGFKLIDQKDGPTTYEPL